MKPIRDNSTTSGMSACISGVDQQLFTTAYTGCMLYSMSLHSAAADEKFRQRLRRLNLSRLVRSLDLHHRNLLSSRLPSLSSSPPPPSLFPPMSSGSQPRGGQSNHNPYHAFTLTCTRTRFPSAFSFPVSPRPRCPNSPCPRQHQGRRRHHRKSWQECR